MKAITTLRKTAVSLAVLAAASVSMPAQSDNFNTGKYLEIQSMILRTLQSQYVDSVSLEDLLRTGIDAMLDGLDP